MTPMGNEIAAALMVVCITRAIIGLLDAIHAEIAWRRKPESLWWLVLA